MNYTEDDYGRRVVAVGAPGSIERMRCERPQLIDRLNSLYWQAHESPGRAVDEALALIRRAGVDNPLETNSILLASDYSLESNGTVTALLLAVGARERAE